MYCPAVMHFKVCSGMSAPFFSFSFFLPDGVMLAWSFLLGRNYWQDIVYGFTIFLFCQQNPFFPNLFLQKSFSETINIPSHSFCLTWIGMDDCIKLDISKCWNHLSSWVKVTLCSIFSYSAYWLKLLEQCWVVAWSVYMYSFERIVKWFDMSWLWF